MISERFGLGVRSVAMELPSNGGHLLRYFVPKDTCSQRLQGPVTLTRCTSSSDFSSFGRAYYSAVMGGYASPSGLSELLALNLRQMLAVLR